MDDLNLIYPVVKVSPKLNKTYLDQYVLVTDYCLLKNLLNEILNDALCSNEEGNDLNITNHDESSCVDVETKNICCCVLNTFEAKPLSKIKLQIDLLLFSVLMYELERSKSFRQNALKRFCKHSSKTLNSAPKILQTCSLCNKTLWLIQVKAYLTNPETNVLDYRWNKKLEILVNERCELENAMAWLSTLGGAFSALGDYFVDCAEKAGLISIQQLRLALRLGDPITICQCKIYLAMSLLQRGYFSKAKNLIRELYVFATSPEGSKDFRLKNMCIAVWNKLKYTLSEKKKGRCKSMTLVAVSNNSVT